VSLTEKRKQEPEEPKEATASASSGRRRHFLKFLVKGQNGPFIKVAGCTSNIAGCT